MNEYPKILREYCEQGLAIVHENGVFVTEEYVSQSIFQSFEIDSEWTCVKDQIFDDWIIVK
jgi:hypothetical protein